MLFWLITVALATLAVGIYSYRHSGRRTAARTLAIGLVSAGVVATSLLVIMALCFLATSTSEMIDQRPAVEQGP